MRTPPPPLKCFNTPAWYPPFSLPPPLRERDLGTILLLFSEGNNLEGSSFYYSATSTLFESSCVIDVESGIPIALSGIPSTINVVRYR